MFPILGGRLLKAVQMVSTLLVELFPILGGRLLKTAFRVVKTQSEKSFQSLEGGY